MSTIDPESGKAIEGMQCLKCGKGHFVRSADGLRIECDNGACDASAFTDMTQQEHDRNFAEFSRRYDERQRARKDNP